MFNFMQTALGLSDEKIDMLEEETVRESMDYIIAGLDELFKSRRFDNYRVGDFIELMQQ